MSSSILTLAIFAVTGTIMSKPTQVLHTRNFFVAGKIHIDAEPGALHWFGFQVDTKVDEPARFSIFDMFANEADRDDHPLTSMLACSILCLTPLDVEIDPHEGRSHMTPMVMMNGRLCPPRASRHGIMMHHAAINLSVITQHGQESDD
ncbi:hypothetical protein HETIRDRAFT_118709 [Heterobasidion irregulare TC 32-1]|uniref:Uncharacterized protein n=1 Tax=Heterobasidion irregulare (strain TC 32-1) TaxID=747525 RepID=W4JSC9_HETIT|nr:uncharacterized protein HETIRDRAFT_118709 [Heterobasidion irregulare TC 32-1]ETW76354.1 hypothetical protein HETIRDRAFT_118709 [Heterobasidion irregulare TC 32-1]